ncbi:MAG: Rieske (2Fe-2S) protein [Thermoleophilia bacterium]
MAGSEWVVTIEQDRVPEGGYVAVYPKGVGVLLVRVEGVLFAIANRCAHMGCPLEGGKLRGPILTCPCHDWRFDVRDGRFVTAPELRLRTFATRIEDGKVALQLDGVK